MNSQSSSDHLFRPGVVGIKVPGDISPPCVGLCGDVSFTLTRCKSMEGGFIFQGTRVPFTPVHQPSFTIRDI